MAKEFWVARMANKQDGSTLNVCVGYDDEKSAWKAYWKTLAQAIDSENLTDALSIMTKGGFQLDYKCFEHEPIPEQPNEEPIEEEGEGE